MFGCVVENTIENTFSTYYSHFLTFSQLPNKYIISFLNPETQIKPRKKIHNPVATGFDERRDRAKPIGAAIKIGAKARSRSGMKIYVEDDQFWGTTRSGTMIWVKDDRF